MKIKTLLTYLALILFLCGTVGLSSSQATLRGSLTNTCRKQATYFFYRAAHPIHQNILKPTNQNIVVPVKHAVAKVTQPVKDFWAPISAWKDRFLTKFFENQKIRFKPISDKIKGASYTIKAAYYKALIGFSPTDKRQKKLIELALKGLDNEVLTFEESMRLIKENIPAEKVKELLKIDLEKNAVEMLFDPEPMLRQVYITQITNKIKAPQLKQWLTDINLYSDQLKIIVEKIPQVIPPEHIRLYQNYIQYAQGFKSKRSLEALEVLDKLHFMDDKAFIRSEYKYAEDEVKKYARDKRHVSKFNDLLKSFSDHEEIMLELNYKRITKKHPNISDDGAFNIAQNFAKKRRLKYENIKLACRAKVSNVHHKAAKVNLKNFYILLGLGSTTVGYAWANQDEEWDKEWWGKLGFEQAVTLVFGYVNSRAFSNPTDSKLQRFMKGLGIGTAGDLVTGEAYVNLFGDQTPNAKKKFEKLVKSKKFKGKIEKLFKEWDDLGVYKRIEEAFYQYRYKVFIEKYLSSSPELMKKFNLNDSENAEWDNLWKSDEGLALKERIQKMNGGKEFSLEMLDASDFEDEHMRNVLLKELAEKMKTNPEGGIFQSDNPARDLLYYNRAYGLPAAVKGLALGLLTYKLLCERGINQKLNMGMAMSIFILDSFASRIVYFEGRKMFIGF